MKKSQVFGIILALALIVFGTVFPTPEKHLRVSSYDYNNPWTDNYGEEYVGGDAYNYQMEASLKAGYMSGVLAMKSITFVGGVLLLFLTCYSRVKCITIEEQTRAILDMTQSTERCLKTLEGLSESTDKQRGILVAVSVTLDKYITTGEKNNIEEETV